MVRSLGVLLVLVLTVVVRRVHCAPAHQHHQEQEEELPLLDHQFLWKQHNTGGATISTRKKLDQDHVNVKHAISATQKFLLSYQQEQEEQLLKNKHQTNSVSGRRSTSTSSILINQEGNSHGSRSLRRSKKSKGELQNKSVKIQKKSKKKSKKVGKKTTKLNRCTNLFAENEGWHSWSSDVDTFTPVYYPETDKELQSIVKESKANGCQIRMVGTGHSEGGLVMQRKEQNVVLVSLKSHSTSIEEWNNSFNPSESSFRIGAGKTFYDVSAMIRPHGYIMKSRQALPLFSIGGVIANTVHGGGRATGFIYDDVVRMLVLMSDGNFQEVEGEEDLQYWRSSAGQLGIIVCVEMSMHSEALAPFIGFDPSTGEPIFDETKGGLNMERERTYFDVPTNTVEFVNFIETISAKVYETSAMHDYTIFFFNGYANYLAEFRTNFLGPRFSGPDGSFSDATKSAVYGETTKGYQTMFAEGLPALEFSKELACKFFCVPPSGTIANGGDGSPCIPIPSSIIPGKRMCDVPLETSAAISEAGISTLESGWDQISSTSNDGFFILPQIANYHSLVMAFPARSFGRIFGAWYEVFVQVISGNLPFSFFPSQGLEFRFIDPKETAVMNPFPTKDEIENSFNQKYPFLEDAYNALLPPLPDGVPDGLVIVESPISRGIFDENVSLYFITLQQVLSAIPTNPMFPYSELVVPDCDPSNGILPCGMTPSIPVQGCCNPPIPSYFGHFGKGWAWGNDSTTTPTTGKFQPFKDHSIMENIFTADNISKFKEKIVELDAGLFSGGSLMQWLDPSAPNSDFEVRKLSGQTCDSPLFLADPDKECIDDSCIDAICE